MDTHLLSTLHRELLRSVRRSWWNRAVADWSSPSPCISTSLLICRKAMLSSFTVLAMSLLCWVDSLAAGWLRVRSRTAAAQPLLSRRGLARWCLQ